MTVKDATDDVIADYKTNGRKSLRDVDSKIRLHLLPFFGERRRMSSISTANIRAFIAERQDAGASAAEINRELAALRRAFNLAVQAGRLIQRPHFPMLKERNTRRGFLERDQVDKICAALEASEDGDDGRKTAGALANVVRFAFINSIDVFNQDKTADHSVVDNSKKEKSYREFLLYSHFYATKMPVIICEGDTDNVYLTHAIRSLAPEFPDLAEVKDKKISLRVRLYKYPRTSTARILGLKEGGTGDLSKFLLTYKNETERFAAPGLTEPVIMLFDNDAGAGAIKSMVTNKFKVKLTGDEPFVHVLKNVYAVPTPKPTGATQSKIEDFFSAETKAIPHDGKTFDSTDADKTKHLSKRAFAHQVVRPNADKIDFAGFKPLLTNIAAAIQKHRAG